MVKKEAESKDQSEFNAAIAKLMRIDKIEQLLIASTLDHDYDDKYRALTAYFHELISIMNDKDDELQQIRWEEISLMYYQYLDDVNKFKKPRLIVWHELLKWETELRNIEQRYGLALPKKADARHSLGGR